MEFTLKSDSCRLNDDAQDDCDSHVYVSVSEFLEMIATPDGELFDSIVNLIQSCAAAAVRWEL